MDVKYYNRRLNIGDHCIYVRVVVESGLADVSCNFGDQTVKFHNLNPKQLDETIDSLRSNLLSLTPQYVQALQVLDQHGFSKQ